MKISAKRNGAAIVELALCIPFLVFLILASIEINNSFFIKQTLTSCAHEGALMGTNLNVTESDILARVQNLADNVFEDSPCDVTMETASGRTYDAADSGEIFTVVVGMTPKNVAKELLISKIEARISAIKP